MAWHCRPQSRQPVRGIVAFAPSRTTPSYLHLRSHTGSHPPRRPPHSLRVSSWRPLRNSFSGCRRTRQPSPGPPPPPRDFSDLRALRRRCRAGSCTFLYVTVSSFAFAADAPAPSPTSGVAAISSSLMAAVLCPAVALLLSNLCQWSRGPLPSSHTRPTVFTRAAAVFARPLDEHVMVV
ncbi:hypothetical protein SETIT_6G044400v2 [Setaria italica]|uniref:Uncharacterized protein n=1 Tax=Setaria italica TaxID=4555 RepID=A0A368RHY4_SETIT|nr:hypothetical protein SETIT_6G044400v2 [Setaria italica]